MLAISLERIESWRSSEMKVLVLRGILEMLKIDKNGVNLTEVCIKCDLIVSIKV